MVGHKATRVSLIVTMLFIFSDGLYLLVNLDGGNRGGPEARTARGGPIIQSRLNTTSIIALNLKYQI